MSVRIFSSEEEGIEALRDAGDGHILEPCQWRLRLHSWDEIEELNELDQESVPVSLALVTFSSRVDLVADEMTDEDWISLGKFVAELAASNRRKR